MLDIYVCRWYITSMKRTTVWLDEIDIEILKKAKKEFGVGYSEYIRRAIKEKNNGQENINVLGKLDGR